MPKVLAATDFQTPDGETFLWQFYDPRVKADLYSTALPTASGLFFVDPIPLESNSLRRMTAKAPAMGIVVSNSNHCRAAVSFATEFATPIFAHPVTCARCQFPESLCSRYRKKLASDLEVIEIEGAVAGEIALYSSRQGGTMIIGDALINFEPYGFALLPQKYCLNRKRLRTSLRQLLRHSFKRMFFAHGTPLLGAAHERLELLLKG